jgi:hypothetical protein
MMVKKMTDNLSAMNHGNPQNISNNSAKINRNNMNLPNFPTSSLTDTSSHHGDRTEIGCWGKFLDCLGLAERKDERLISEDEGKFEG